MPLCHYCQDLGQPENINDKWPGDKNESDDAFSATVLHHSSFDEIQRCGQSCQLCALFSNDLANLLRVNPKTLSSSAPVPIQISVLWQYLNLPGNPRKKSLHGLRARTVSDITQSYALFAEPG